MTIVSNYDNFYEKWRKPCQPDSGWAFSQLPTDEWEGDWGKRSPFLTSVTYILEWWNLAHFYLSYRRPKKKNHVTQSMRSANINIYLPEINNFCYIKKCRFRVHFKSLFAFILSLFESWNVVLINMVAMLTMWGKLATLGRYKNTIIWKRIWCHNLSVRSPKINCIKRLKIKR